VDNVAMVHAVDLLGNGTTCLTWSSPLPDAAGRQMRYLDLMGGTKPHLLTKVVNNLGAETTIQYAASTKFYLQDKADGRPWVTKLPFPVHVVEKLTIKDRWRHSSFATTYSYHHGHFDGIEREFRGFGRVEQVDAETYGRCSIANQNSPYVTDNQKLYQPPIKTITWFHTGAMLDRERILSQFAAEYFPRSLAALPTRATIDAVFVEKPLAEPPLDALDLTTDEWREALRACKGTTLRQEIYELDVDELDRSGRHVPVRLFSTASRACAIRRVQPRDRNEHAVFLVTETEALTYHYELGLRPPAPDAPLVLQPDPRIAHTINLSIDAYGNVQQALTIGYPRVRQFGHPDLTDHVDLVREVQRERHVAYTETRYTNDAIDPASGPAPIQYYRLRVPFDVQTYELTGVAPTLGRYFDRSDARTWDLSTAYGAAAPSKAFVRSPYHRLPQNSASTMRLVEHARTRFFDDDAAGPQAAARFLRQPLALGRLGKLGLPYERYKLALTEQLLDAVFDAARFLDAVPAGGTVRARLRTPDVSGYMSGEDFFTVPPPGVNPPPDAADEYWIRSGVAGFASDAAVHFFLPEKFTDVFGKETLLTYDARYDLFVESVRDAAGNTTSVTGFDYRVLAPVELRDASNNLSRVAFDALGLMVASAVMGKQGTESGDSVAGVTLDISAAEIGQFLSDPYRATTPAGWLGRATARFVYDFGTADRPPSACGIVRETHVLPGGISRIQTSIEYSDGMGAVLVRKAQAEPDPNLGAGATLRWIASGKTVLNNKGKPVKQYEPYFSATEHRFDRAETESEVGVTSLMYYDAPGRLARTELPDGTISRVEFSPWHVETSDPNDAVIGTRWHIDRGSPDPTQSLPANASAPRRAAWLSARHAGTSALTLLDSLGREVISVVHNRAATPGGPPDERHVTFTRLDAEGKPLWVRNPIGHLVMQYVWPPRPHLDDPRTPRNFGPGGNPNADLGARAPTYDLAGNLFFQHSMDAGDRWMINDAAGQPMFAWDVNDRHDANDAWAAERRFYVTDYDDLHRPTALWLRVNNGQAARIERYEYQDGQANDPNNLNGQLVRRYDPSGCAEMIRRDFAGNVREETRRLNNRPAASAIDWAANPQASLAADTFARITDYDALGRVTRQFNWHRTTVGSPVALYEPRYNERGALVLESLTLRLLKGAADIEAGPDTTISNPIEKIHYNEKGQKTLLELGNGTLTQYDYDRERFRLVQIRTTSPEDPTGFPGRRANRANAGIVQQLLYTYDAAGNVTEVEDQAFEPVFFQNQAVEARSRFEYDALYRLTRAQGRENGALRGAPKNLEAAPERFPLAPPNPNALRMYTQTYAYDSAGNITRVDHDAGAGSWTRQYSYAFDDAAQPPSNQLWQTRTGTPVRTITYAHDLHGNMRNLDAVSPEFYLRWDHRDMLHRVDLGGGGWASYQYDAAKQRSRKRVDNPNGFAGSWERIALGGYELYRRFNAGGGVVEEIESHHVVEGEQRVLLVDDVLVASDALNPRPDGVTVSAQTLFRYQYSNLIGSACLELDDAARVISYEEYHPYGTTAYRAADGDIEAPPKRYRYTGMERDEESGLNYHGARYYAAWIARWISSDPLRRPGDNLFRALGNNPIRNVDPSGMAELPRVQRTHNFDPVTITATRPSKDVAAQGQASPSVIEHDIQLRNEKAALTARDEQPPPTLARDKLKPVHNVTAEHQEKVRSLVNSAILSAAMDAKAGTSTAAILSEALTSIVKLREADIPGASSNLIYRDADHYLAARIQEYPTRVAAQLNSAGILTSDQALHLAFSPKSRELNYAAVGPVGVVQLYETMKLQEFKREAQSGPEPKGSVAVGKNPPSAAGGTEWVLLGMLDYERYDAANAAGQGVPHLLGDLPGTGERYSTNPDVPDYLRDEAKRIADKIKNEAIFTK
jgi:RHS repeat-associated protein